MSRPLRTLPGTRRSLLLGALATILAACGTSTRSASPAAATTAPSAAAVETPAATVLPTIRGTPNPNCPTTAALFAEQPLFVAVAPDPGRANLELQVTSVEVAWDPTSRYVPPPQPTDGRDAGLLLGGHEFLISPTYFYDVDGGPTSMLAATATLTPLGRDAIALAVRIVPGNEYFDQFAIAVPDMSGPARLDLALEWTDDCFRFTAETSRTVTVVPLSTSQGCPLDQDHWANGLDALFAAPIDVSGTKQDIWPSEFQARYVNEGTEGDPPVWAYLWKRDEEAVAASSGGSLDVAWTVPGLQLAITTAELFRRADALKAASGDSSVAPVWSERPAARAGGGVRVSVDVEPGRYVLVLRFDFQSACLTGQGGSVFSVDVQ